MSGPRRLQFVTRQDCGLCADLLTLLAPYEAAGKVVLELVPLEAHPQGEAYQWRIPVVLEAGVELLWGRVEQAELSATLGEVGVP